MKKRYVWPCRTILPATWVFVAWVVLSIGAMQVGCSGWIADGGYCPKNVEHEESFPWPKMTGSSSSSSGGGMGGAGGGTPSGITCPGRDEALGIFANDTLKYGEVVSVDSDGTYVDGQCSYHVTTLVNPCSA
jgi:hypothetical protein